MNSYHILFKNNLDELMSSGINVEGNSIEEALHMFKMNHPDRIVLAVYTPELMKLLH